MANEIIKFDTETLAKEITGSIMGTLEQIVTTVGDLDERMDRLETSKTIESREQGEIQRLISSRVHFLLSDESPKGWKKYSRTFYMRLHCSLKYRFCIPSYRDIRKVDFDLARDIINGWEPTGGVQALKDEIDAAEEDDVA